MVSDRGSKKWRQVTYSFLAGNSRIIPGQDFAFVVFQAQLAVELGVNPPISRANASANNTTWDDYFSLFPRQPTANSVQWVFIPGPNVDEFL